MPELLQKKTKMRVRKVENGMQVEKNNVYVIPPDNYMSIIDGHLALDERIKKQGPFLPTGFSGFLTKLPVHFQDLVWGFSSVQKL